MTLNRRTLIGAALSLVTLMPVSRLAAVERLTWPPAYWRGKVSDAAWQVLFAEHTEPPHSSPLNHETRAGTYLCAACYLPLFNSDSKYDSGTGWPSFTAPIDASHLGTRIDTRLWMTRTEYHCRRCGGHQGHVFDDGPRPRGERWCNNGLALHFVPAQSPLPALRGDQ